MRCMADKQSKSKAIQSGLRFADGKDSRGSRVETRDGLVLHSTLILYERKRGGEEGGSC